MSTPFTCYATDFSLQPPMDRMLRSITLPWESKRDRSPIAGDPTIISVPFVCEGHEDLDFFTTLPDSYGIERKVRFYTVALAATHQDIVYTENTLFYDRSSDIVQRQMEKAATLRSIIDQLSALQKEPYIFELPQSILDAEQKLKSFNDVFSLHHEFAHLFSESFVQIYNPEAKEASILVTLGFLMWGRMLRYFFRRVVRDIRQFFRSIVGILFMHMNDQTGDDEFLVRSAFRRPSIHSFKNWSSYGQGRNFGPD